jgi:hypothetical protein
MFLAMQRWKRALFLHCQAQKRLEFIRDRWPVGHQLLRDAHRDADIAETKALENGLAVPHAK